MENDAYTDLLARRELLYAEWLKRVDAGKAAGHTHHTLNGVGPIFLRTGALTIFVTENGLRTYDLVIFPFTTDVVEVRAE